MEQLKHTTKRFITTSIAVFFVMATAIPSLAVVNADSCNPVTATAGNTAPTGPEAVTYTYDECTGLWVSPHYTWNPATKETKPIVPLVYTYNSDTEQWDSSKWVYDTTDGSWSQKSFSVETPPAGAETIGGPSAVEETNTNDTTVDDTSDSTVSNNIGSTSASGDATVSDNYSAGSATSGNAQAIANVINMLQSSSGLGSTAATFVANIDGDVQGDLIIDPSFLQPASVDLSNSNNLDVNIDNSGVITNNIDLDASTGNATVDNNYSAGDATSGNAEAVANVVNMLNSMIAAQQSFVGVVNINGNFNGNILMPQSFLDSLIASNAPHEDVNISNDTLNSINANLSNSTNISNNVTSTATSGDANVSGNFSGGSATSGNASTNVTIFNLTNQQIVGRNTLLVFVNVLGKWVGVLMDAPGSTAAAYGGGITTASTNTANINGTNSGTITNNINTNASSGDASVTDNYKGGNARSGDAETAVNLSNITNSSINLSGWFGILFINVFGNWYGSFGVAKPAVSPSAGTGAAPAQTFNFLPKKSAGSNHFNFATATGNGSYVDPALAAVATKVLGTSVGTHSSATKDAAVQHDTNEAALVGGALFAAGLILMLIEVARNRIQNRAR
jgi:hypothetical protein